MDIFCGSDLPPVQKSYSKMEIILRTDAYGQLPGFQLKYFLSGTLNFYFLYAEFSDNSYIIVKCLINFKRLI